MKVSNLDMIDRFIGIDWSGDRRARINKLQVAVCSPGELGPKLESPAEEKYWSRDEIAQWVVQEANNKCVLIGMDFAFAFPYCDKNTYFPGHHQGPESVEALWEMVDTVCKDEPNFYGGTFYRNKSSHYSKYFWYPKFKGARFDGSRLRVTEKACQRGNAKPACSFKCLGPDQVGPGSVAGMRTLHHINKIRSNSINIWPFDSFVDGKSTIVEIFPRLFYILAGQKPQDWNKIDVINAILRYFGSKPLHRDVRIRTEDEADAIISAAALRGLSSNEDLWNPLDLDERTRLYEGWIFGIK